MYYDVDFEFLRKQLIRHEGLRLKPYTDTVGKLTIGVGRNLTDQGISEETANQMLNEDLQRVIRELNTVFPWFKKLSTTRQYVFINMCFNLGLTRFSDFRLTLEAARVGDYHEAARQMLSSRWAEQVGARAIELAEMMDTDGMS